MAHFKHLLLTVPSLSLVLYQFFSGIKMDCFSCWSKTWNILVHTNGKLPKIWHESLKIRNNAVTLLNDWIAYGSSTDVINPEWKKEGILLFSAQYISQILHIICGFWFFTWNTYTQYECSRVCAQKRWWWRYLRRQRVALAQ